MATTSIEWTDVTWNPVRGCSRVSEGCRNCYAERMASRFTKPGQPYEGLAQITPNGPRWTGEVHLIRGHLRDPLKWRKPRRIFVNSMSDLFHEKLSNEDIAEVFAVICETLHDWPRRHTYQILTKRAERLPEWFAWAKQHWGGWFNSEGMLDLGNVWIGVSIEDQKTADARIRHLLNTPAKVRFLSMEPLLGPVDLTRYLGGGYVTFDPKAGKMLPARVYNQPLQWVIVGGESGPGARPMHPDWARTLRDQCQASGVPFFFKQHGAWVDPDEFDASGYDDVVMRENGITVWPDGRTCRLEMGYCNDGSVRMWNVGKKAAGRELDGRTWDELPGGAA